MRERLQHRASIVLQATIVLCASPCIIPPNESRHNLSVLANRSRCFQAPQTLEVGCKHASFLWHISGDGGIYFRPLACVT